MLQSTPVGTVKVGPVVQRVHLVHLHAVERGGACLQLVDQRDRLAVRNRHHQIRTARQLVDQRLDQFGGRRWREGEAEHGDDDGRSS